MLINRPALQGGKFIKQTGVCAVRKTGVLNVKFKKGWLDRELAYGLVQPTGDDDALIYDKYELSKHEIFKILKQKFEALNAKKRPN